MSSPTVVCNLAISHLGKGKEIQSLETDRSEEGRACRSFYELARDEMLRDFVWPFCTKIVALALVEEEPNDEYGYAYRYPSDCLFFRKIQSGIRNDTRSTRVPYRIGADDQGQLIFTDKQNAIAEYTSTIGQNPAKWHPDFTFAVSYRIAAYIASRITGGDPFKTGEKSLQLWNLSNRKAMANAANEEQAEDIPDGELILSRF